MKRLAYSNRTPCMNTRVRNNIEPLPYRQKRPRKIEFSHLIVEGRIGQRVWNRLSDLLWIQWNGPQS